MCQGTLRGMTSSKSSRAASRASLTTSRTTSFRSDSCDIEDPPLESSSSVSYLTVPHSPGHMRRPSTADVFIEKLKVERLEGGGLSISGVALASNCHLSLIIFGAFFLLAGIVLSYVGFARNSTSLQFGDTIDGVRQAARTSEVQKDGNMQVIGPSFVLAGCLMLLLGFALFGLSKKIQRDEKEQRKALSELQLCQMESNFNYVPVSPPHHTTAPVGNEPYPILSIRRGSYWMDAVTDEEPKMDHGTPVEPQVPPLTSRATSPLQNNNTNDWTHQVDTNLPQDTYSSPTTPRNPLSARLSGNLIPGEYFHTDIATFPHEDIMDSRVPSAVQRRRDIDQEIPYEYYQHQQPVELPQSSGKLEQIQQETLLQYQQLQAQRLKEQQQWRSSAGSRQLPQIQVTTPGSQVVLPRLSRHCTSARPEGHQPPNPSRPTTAEAR